MRPSGFTLTEVLIAVGVFSVGLAGVMAHQQQALQMARRSAAQSDFYVLTTTLSNFLSDTSKTYTCEMLNNNSPPTRISYNSGATSVTVNQIRINGTTTIFSDNTIYGSGLRNLQLKFTSNTALPTVRESNTPVVFTLSGDVQTTRGGVSTTVMALRSKPISAFVSNGLSTDPVTTLSSCTFQ